MVTPSLIQFENNISMQILHALVVPYGHAHRTLRQLPLIVSIENSLRLIRYLSYLTVTSLNYTVIPLILLHNASSDDDLYQNLQANAWSRHQSPSQPIIKVCEN